MIVGARPARRIEWPARRTWLSTGLLGVLSAPLAFVAQGGGHTPDAGGWVLFTLCVLAAAWRRLHPLGVMLVLVVLEGTYHSLQNAHSALILVTMVAVYSLAVAGPRSRTLIVVPTLMATTVAMMLHINPDKGIELLRTSGWILACALAGEAVRTHRNYIAAIVERAERAERTREETAARRVAEERLRIARDLHDLLAHSITLIGVQTSVAAHVLTADPQRLDRAALATALDGIADTCREARGELRPTLRVLHANEDNGPPPGLAALPDLGQAAESAGARVTLAVDADAAVPGAVGAAAYRIVQQALTNAVQHAGPAPGIEVTVALDRRARVLRVDVVDDGTSAGAEPDGTSAAARPAGRAQPAGFGLAGMAARARSVGGTLEAGPRTAPRGFAVRAILPCDEGV